MMKFPFLFLSILPLFSIISSPDLYSAPLDSPYSLEKNRVILLMLDGVRWQEFFHGVQAEQNPDPTDASDPIIFKKLFQGQSPSSLDVFLGDKGANPPSEMLVANNAILSLPAYQSIMAGYTQGCLTNECGKITVETVQERILREENLPKGQVATIASWNGIANAVEHIRGASFVNVGGTPLDDGTQDDVIQAINQGQKKDTPPWVSARYDKYTMAHALHYLKKHQPRFLFISLNDSDEWAHLGNYKNYLKSLRQYDEWIEQIKKVLNEMGEKGSSTTLLVTTDHGRGNGFGWRHHGSIYPEAKNIWFYGYQMKNRTEIHAFENDGSSEVEGDLSQRPYSHLDIRPTIEVNLGLTPWQCDRCGKPIQGN